MVKTRNDGKESRKSDIEISNSLKKIVWGAGIVLLGRMLGKLVGYAFILVAARLGSENYGMLNLGLSISSLFITLSLLGFESGVVRYIPYYLVKKDKARVKGTITSTLQISFFISLFLASLMFFFSHYLAVNLFHNPSLTSIFKIFSVTVPFMALVTLLMAILRGFQRVDYDAVLKEVIEKVIRFLSILLLISIGFGIIGAAFSYILSSFVVLIIAFFVLEKKVFSVFNKQIVAIKPTKELMAYSLPMLLVAFSYFATGWSDTLLLGFFKSVSDVGVYNAAVPTAALMFVLPGALTSLFIQITTQFYSKNKKTHIQKVYGIVSRWVFAVNLPLFLLMFAFSSQILRISFGSAYTVAAPVLSIVAFGYLVYSLSYTSQGILSVLKRTKLLFVITLIFSLINVGINYFLIPLYGIKGAAIGTCFSYILAASLFIFFSFKHSHLQPFRKEDLKMMASAILSIGIVQVITRMIFKAVPLYGFAIMLIVFGILYPSFLLLFKCFEKEDVEMIKLILKRISSKKKNRNIIQPHTKNITLASGINQQ